MGTEPAKPEASATEIGRALAERWGVVGDVRRGVLNRVLAILVDSDTSKRVKLRAAELIRRMADDDAQLDIAAARDERLNRGDPTERIELRPITLTVAERIDRDSTGDVPRDSTDPPASPPD